jgi:hypothetical protein
VTHVSELERERFALTAPPPVRTLAIAALLAIIGVALMVGSRALGLGPVVLVLGIACLALAVALALAGVILVSRLRSTLVLDADGISLIRGRRTERLTWSDIDSVNLTGHRLTFHTKLASRTRVSVINPKSATDPTFTSLLRAIRGRLDANRGYRTSSR